MLILTRRQGESIWIGDDIEVVVMGIGSNQVRIGIAAPKSVVIRRDDMVDRDPKRPTSNEVTR